VKRLMQQAFELWINPEVERRRVEGILPQPFVLMAAQRLQWPSGKIEVRFNEEVQGVAAIKATREIEAGEQVLASDIDGLEMFDLVDDELDAGHWTLLRTGETWFIGFNFLTNRGKCVDLLEKAEEFVQIAKEARAREYAAVAVDTLFSACELIAKAELVASRQLELDAKSHGRVSSKLNLWRRTGNVEGAFVDIFNRLAQLRPRYRYDAAVSERMPISEEDLSLVEDMLTTLRNRVSNKVRSPVSTAS